MNAIKALVVFFLIALGTATYKADAGTKENITAQTSNALSDIVEKVAPSVVHIIAEQKMDSGIANIDIAKAQEIFEREPDIIQVRTHGVMTGSGFVWQHEKSGFLVMTNAHVIGQASHLTVVVDDGRSFNGELIGMDTISDIGVIRVRTDKPLPPAVLSEEESIIKPGDTVFAVGSPLGFDRSVTSGIISAINRSDTDPAHQLTPFIQTDAAINPGSSGGPLFNQKGRVIGINTQILSTGPSVGFIGIGLSIPIQYAEQVANILLEKGKLSRGWLGIIGQSIDADMEDIFPNARQGSVVVSGIAPSSPAKGVLEAGDIIDTFDGSSLDGVEDFAWRCAVAGPGAYIEIGVRRGKDHYTRRLRLDSIPSAKEETKGDDGKIQPHNDCLQAVIDEQATKKLNLENPVLRITHLSDNARRSGLGVGDVIARINDNPTLSQDTLTQTAEENKTNLFYVFRNGRWAFLSVNADDMDCSKTHQERIEIKPDVNPIGKPTKLNN